MLYLVIYYGWRLLLNVLKFNFNDSWVFHKRSTTSTVLILLGENIVIWTNLYIHQISSKLIHSVINKKSFFNNTFGIILENLASSTQTMTSSSETIIPSKGITLSPTLSTVDPSTVIRSSWSASTASTKGTPKHRTVHSFGILSSNVASIKNKNKLTVCFICKHRFQGEA